jgi:hypothetical protein
VHTGVGCRYTSRHPRYRQPGGCGGVEAGESPYGSGETGKAGAGAGVRERAWFSGPEKGRFSSWQ